VTRDHRTQVGIVGAGPAGLLLGHLLHRHGIESVVLEVRSRHYVEHRIRAGVLEQGTVDLLNEAGVGERMQREGLVHGGIELRFDRRSHRIDFPALAGGRTITVYGQTEVVKDLITARLEAGAPLLFEVDDVSVHDLDADRPAIRYTHEGEQHELRCDVIAGCDGFHGVCRPSVPDGALEEHQREYPFAWLGILAEVPPSTEELIYARHERGFALHSMRTPELSRFYLQCDPDDDPDAWRDEQIWEELDTRLERDGWELNRDGPIIEKSVTPMRSFVVEPMHYGNLFLAGDAAHIVPPTGAKGLNLAVGDVRELARGLRDWYADRDRGGLEAYSDRCLRRVWRAEHFSWWMTSMLHRFPDENAGFEARLQRAQLDYVCRSEAAATTLAENYVGFVWEEVR
jgi:p-hydroxybenzoate 3-monooxygenase